MPDPSSADLLELFQRAQASFTDRVDAVQPGRWDAEALPGWTAADLVAHLVHEALWVPPLLAGAAFGQVDGRIADATGDLLGADPLTSWEAAADAALAALAEPGALDRTVDLSRGPVPATQYVEELTTDLTVHSWDLARATGGDTELDPALVTAALAVADRMPEGGAPGLFDPPLDVPATASPQTRLLARLGRRDGSRPGG